MDDDEIYVPILNTNLVDSITQNTAQSGGNIIHDGDLEVIARGVVWSTDSVPTIDLNDGMTVDGDGIGIFVSHITGLTEDTQYFICSYATNSEGTAYGQVLSFVTPALSVPELTTKQPIVTTLNSATSGGYVTSSGGMEMFSIGIVWNTSGNPTVDSNEGITSNGTELGGFLCEMTGLVPATHYYIRAYATNSYGTGYGNEVSLFINEHACPFLTSFVDERDGNLYNTVLVDDECWMAENLKYLPWFIASDNYDAKYYAYGYTGYSIAEAQETGNYHTYGVLYSWDAANNACPSGWHLPGDDEWTDLSNYLISNGYNYDESTVGNKIAKSMAAQNFWSTATNEGAIGNILLDNNQSGFTALPGGEHYFDSFGSLGTAGYWWTSNQAMSGSHYYRGLYFNNDELNRNYEYDSKAMSVRCLKNDTLPIIHTTIISDLFQTFASSGGNIEYSGGDDIVSRGIVWSIQQNPTLENNDGFTIDGTGSGEFTSFLSELLPETTYYVRSYATNSVGTQYGEQLDFISAIVASPTITTSEIVDLTHNSATSGGFVIVVDDLNVIARGLVWSTQPNPDILVNEGITVENIGTGNFVSLLDGLYPSTTYYVRAYVTLNQGTAYGQEISFETLEFPNCGIVEFAGYDYSTILIGNQCWFAENVRYDNGCSSAEFANFTDSGWCGYFNSNESEYGNLGLLYQNSVAESICPIGWHLPSHNDWKELELSLGMSSDVVDDTQFRGTNEGSKLAGNANLWTSNDLTADPEFGTSGFDALPGGYRDSYGDFLNQQTAHFSVKLGSNIWDNVYRLITGYSTQIGNFGGITNCAFSVRCLKDQNMVDTIPTVITIGLSDVTPNSAVFESNVVYDGESDVLQKGVILGVNPGLTINSVNIEITNQGNGTGYYESNVTGLSPATVYYYRAYAINSVGVSYGEENCFGTLVEDAPLQNPCLETPTVMYHGYTYNTVSIGDQCWMAENLKYLPSVNYESTNSNNTPRFYVYGYSGIDTVAAQATSNFNTYGVLYNKLAMLNGGTYSNTNPSTLQGICPNGWHIPSFAEWNQMVVYVGGSTVAGGKIKEVATTHWNCPNIGGNNEYGFTALPGGVLENGGSFYYLNEYGAWWCADATASSSRFSLGYLSAGVNQIPLSLGGETVAMSVRCVRDYLYPVVETMLISEIAQTVATSGGNIISDGGLDIIQQGIVWSTSEDPTLENCERIVLDTNLGSSEFICHLDSLIYGTVYYVKAFATNSFGISYGDQVVFQTNPQANLAVVITTPATLIEMFSALSGGEVLDDGGEPQTISGLVWSKLPNPSVDMNDGITQDGFGQTVFTSELSELICDQTYYYKAYAINTGGISYGQELSFNTDGVSDCSPVFYNGYSYRTVQIGCQCWLAENLRYLPTVKPVSISASLTVPACYVHGYSGYNVDEAKETEAYIIYGAAYNNFAAQNYCPSGWKLPSNDDWKTLELFLGVPEEELDDYNHGTNQGSQLSGVDSLWYDFLLVADAEFGTSGFDAIPGGYREYNASGNSFTDFGNGAIFWSSTEKPNNGYYYRQIRYNSTDITMHYEYQDSYSVRCVKNLENDDISGFLPDVSTLAVSSITDSSAVVLSVVNESYSEEPDSRGVVWSTSSGPTIEINNGMSSSGNGLGEFSANLIGLVNNQEYFVRSYATNHYGTSYGNEISFAANSLNLPPTVQTISILDITPTSVSVIGSVIFEGANPVYERGIVWGINSDISIDSNMGRVASGSGSGEFTCFISALEESSSYFVRSYAISNSGISYGEALSIQTASFQNCGTYEYFGYFYNTVVIGNQCWFNENLKYLPAISSASSTSTTLSKYYVYDVSGLYGVSNAKQSYNYLQYGTIYNWLAAQSACPYGWKLPSDGDWNVLEAELGMTIEEISNLQYRGTDEASELAANNNIWAPDSLLQNQSIGSSGFDALPGGWLSGSSFMSRSLKSKWWTASQGTTSTYAFIRGIDYNYSRINKSEVLKSSGCYVRCLRDTTVVLSLPEITTSSITNITQTTLVAGGNVISLGSPSITSCGVVWSTSPNPDINNFEGKSTGTLVLGEFTYQVSGLDSSTQYYFRAYATNMLGTVYGTEFMIETPEAALLPTVSTLIITGITQTTSTINSIVIDGGGELGIVNRGVVASTNPLPDIENCEFNINCSTGEGNYQALIYGLKDETTYFVRAYAINSTGVSYGEELSFETTAFMNCGTVGYQDHYYETVIIGFQCWMQENLRYLPELTSSADWGDYVESQYSVYGYSGVDVVEAKQTDNYGLYGVLYNWSAAEESCPQGWHLPSDEDWKTLELYIGMAMSSVDSTGYRGTNQGSKLAGEINLWDDNNETLIDNTSFGSSGFYGLCGGYVSENSLTFSYILRSANWWSSSEYSTYSAWSRTIYNTRTSVSRSISNSKRSGMSVRCLRNDDYELSVPTISTNYISGISLGSECTAISGGNITYDGGSAINSSGIVWSTSENPTIESNLGQIQVDTLLGQYSIQITGLLPDVQYFVRAYATNMTGIAYGDQVSFVTIENTDGQFCPDLPLFYDTRDSRVYTTKQYGNQCWMASNLKYLPSVNLVTDASNTLPKYYVYNYSGTDVEASMTNPNYNLYGVLYNWSASLISCPSGWHLPSDEEWKTLEMQLGMSQEQTDSSGYRGNNEGSKLSGSYDLWAAGVLKSNPQFGSTGFNVLPSGNRTTSSTFGSIGASAYFWTSTVSTSTRARNRGFSSAKINIYRSIPENNSGYSVRCLRDN